MKLRIKFLIMLNTLVLKKLKAENFGVRLKSANLVKKTASYDKLTSRIKKLPQIKQNI